MLPSYRHTVLSYSVMVSFDDEGTEDVWNGDDTKAARNATDVTIVDYH